MDKESLMPVLCRDLYVGAFLALVLLYGPVVSHADQERPMETHTATRIRQLLKELESPGDIEAQQAMDELVKIGRPAIEPLLEKIFDPKSSAKIQWRAFLALGEIAARQPAPVEDSVERAFIRMAREHPNFEIRLLAATGLARLQGRHAAPILIEALSDPSEEVRQDVIHALKKLFNRDFGFRADAPEKDRQKAIMKWKNWWDAEGSKQK